MPSPTVPQDWVPLWNLGVAPPSAVSSRIYRAAAQSIPNGAFTPITFDTVRYDNGGQVNLGTQPTRLTCKVAGAYSIWGEIQYTAAAGGAHRLAQIFLNGTTEIACMGLSGMPSINGASGPRCESSSIYQLAVNDYIELRAYQDSGGALNTLTGGAANCDFGMALMGGPAGPQGPTGPPGSSGGGATVATTVAGLGTASNGQMGLIRAGSSPYEEIGLIYDSTKGKWVSHEYVFAMPGSSGTVSASADVMVLWALIDGWDSIKTAGLTMEARLSFFMNANVTTNNGYDFVVGSQAITAGYPTTAAAIGTYLANVRTLPTASNRGYDTGWLAANPASNNRAIYGFSVNSSSTGNTCQWYFPTIRVRFVG